MSMIYRGYYIDYDHVSEQYHVSSQRDGKPLFSTTDAEKAMAWVDKQNLEKN